MSPPAACLIDSFGPLPVERPPSVADLGEVVRRVAAAGQAVYPFGGRTQLAVGLPPSKPGVAVDVRGLSDVVDYPARDMTITVHAGITIAELQHQLAAENQRLPIDVPRPEHATLGGALAANVSGPRRYGWGTLRDYVLGISTINDEGKETKAGGRVVKNVAGYDLCKLHIGALGTLGVITQVTLKVLPPPPARALATLGCDGTELVSLLDLMHASRTRPVCLDMLNPASAQVVAAAGGGPLPSSPWTLVIGYEASEAAVAWQAAQLLKETAPLRTSGLEVRIGPTSDPLWQALTEDLLQPDAALSFKANLLPGGTAAFCLRAAALATPPALHAHFGSGIVRGRCSDLTCDAAASMLKELHAAAEAAQGNIVLTQCPTEWKANLPVWGRRRGDWELMRQVKDALDPHRLFNPGRFVDGI
jgi:glycolate oxidase FAD binding subunit